MKRVIGITRFALLGPMGEGGYFFRHRKQPKAFKTRRDWVFSEGYLAHRLALWQAFGLPSVAAQIVPEDVTYIHLVAVNPELPNRAALAATLPPHALLVDIPMDARLEDGLRDQLRAVCGDEFFTFRLDDDDALVSDFLRSVVSYWSNGRVLAPVKGFFIGINRKTNHFRMVPCECPNAPQGIGNYGVTRTTNGLTVQSPFIHDLGKHSIIPNPCNVNDRPYWLRTVHKSNVTLAGHPGTPWAKRDADVPPEAALRRFFPHLSPAAIEAALRIEPAQDSVQESAD